MSENLYRVNTRDAKRMIERVLFAGLVPFIRSSPGIGKSAITHQLAEELHLQVIDHRLSTSEPTDMSGLPRFDDKGRAYFAPFAELFPLEGDPIPAGKDGWLLFLDEFTSASKQVQAACYKLILDRMVGQHKLHPNVVIVCAGNLDTDRAITNALGTAMQSRLVHIELELDHDIWMYDVAIKQNYDSRIIAFLSQNPSMLWDFRPDHDERTFCCPRTWEFMNRLVKGQEIHDDDAALFAGTITAGTAVNFVQFTKIYASMITLPQIIADPRGCNLPTDNSTRWAVISHMMEKVTDKNFDDLATYANRFQLNFKILFYRSVMYRHPDMRQNPTFISACAELSRYLNG